MSLVPESVERYTTNLLIPIYKYAAGRWHEALNAFADLVDAAIASDRTRITSLEVEHNDDGTHGDLTADTINLSGVKRAAWGTLVTAGTATSGGTNTLTDGNADWGAQALPGMVVAIVAGTGNGQVRKILSHTGTVVTNTEDWTTAPDATSQYEIYATSDQTLSQATVAEAAQTAIGNIANPLLSLPLRNSLVLERGGGTVTFTRASTATYINRANAVKTSAIDEARFENGMLLHEGQSTNDILYSDDYANAAWTKSAVTVTSNDVAGPDGLPAVVDKIVEDTALSAHAIVQTITGVVDNDSVAFSGYAKAAGRNFIYMSVTGKDGVGYGAYFDLASETISNIGSGVVAKIDKKINEDFIRCIILIDDIGAGVANPVAKVSIAYDAGTLNYTGDGVSGVHLWAVQFEKMKTETSYIVTTSAAVTRNADSLSVSATETPGVDQPVTVILDCIISGQQATHQELIAKTPMRMILFGGTTAIRVDHDNSVGFVYDAAFDKFTKKTRIGSRWDGTVTSLWYDGLKKLESANGDALGNSVIVYIGSNNTSSQLYGHISDVRIYDESLTDTEMQLA